MAKNPEIEELRNALDEAGSAHHNYETVILNGVRDELWSGFYAAYVLGKLGNFIQPSDLVELLEKVTDSDDWSNTAAELIINSLNE